MNKDSWNGLSDDAKSRCARHAELPPTCWVYIEEGRAGS